MQTIICKKCGCEYGYEIYGDNVPGGKTRETADCPNCGETGYSTMTSQFIAVYRKREDGMFVPAR